MTLKKAKEKKKMKTRSNMPLFVLECSDITKLTDGQIDLLHCGDYLVKKTGKQRHAYKVTYKEDKQGICLTYHDASTVETVSYDYTGGHWVYNSTDKSQLPLKDGDVYTFDGNLAVFENIVDKDGHKRFDDFDGSEGTTISGYTIDFNKASLSGTHLLIVLAFEIVNNSEIANGNVLARYDLPEWIINKIYPIWDNKYIAMATVGLYADNWTSQSLNCVLSKPTSTRIEIVSTSNLTLTANRKCRIAFDLLIDNE